MIGEEDYTGPATFRSFGAVILLSVVYDNVENYLSGSPPIVWFFLSPLLSTLLSTLLSNLLSNLLSTLLSLFLSFSLFLYLLSLLLPLRLFLFPRFLFIILQLLIKPYRPTTIDHNWLPKLTIIPLTPFTPPIPTIELWYIERESVLLALWLVLSFLYYYIIVIIVSY